jgi:hypothetical protein
MKTTHRPHRDLEKQLADKRAMEGKSEFVKCAFCGYLGTYGIDIVDTDYRKGFVLGCKDIDTCFNRGGGVNAIY